MNEQFETFLQNHDLSGIRSINKSDLHNHLGRGGNINYFSSKFNLKIDPPPSKFESIYHMDEWFRENIKMKCPYIKRLEAGFVQAADDNISVFAPCFGLDDEMTIGGMPIEAFIDKMNSFNKELAPNTILLPELAFTRWCDVDKEYSRLDEVLSYNWFKSLDINSGELEKPIKNFKKIYRKAKDHGLRLRAHVGELGTADDVMEAVEELELDEVHHGIAAADSEFVLNWLSKHKIQLNICPSSNVKLSVVESYEAHPIRKIYDHGIPVTINTDDMLVFNQSASHEYLNLYKCGLMNAQELNDIRKIGLREIDNYEL